MSDRVIERLLAAYDQGYDKRSWHGTNLKGSLRGLSAAEAAWRPAPGRHNVWELAVHAAYWKCVVRRRLTGEAPGGFALDGSDWFPRPQSGAEGEAGWKADRALLESEHRALRAVIAGLADGDLDRPSPGGASNIVLELVTGVTAHDLYHAGQIQLLKRMLRAD